MHTQLLARARLGSLVWAALRKDFPFSVVPPEVSLTSAISRSIFDAVGQRVLKEKLDAFVREAIAESRRDWTVPQPLSKLSFNDIYKNIHPPAALSRIVFSKISFHGVNTASVPVSLAVSRFLRGIT